MSEKYVAYVSTYTMKDKHGISVYDVDLEKGTLSFRTSKEITNSSYMTCSHNDKYLYAITDFGVESYKIMPDGDLETLNMCSINGMRGCYLSTDYEDKFLFVAGYHDGKITALKLDNEGRVEGITDEIYLRGMGEVVDRSFQPHVNCVKMSRDNKYLFVADIGMDHVNVYELNSETGKLKEVDIIRCDQNSAELGKDIRSFNERQRFGFIVFAVMIEHGTVDGIGGLYPTGRKGHHQFQPVAIVGHNVIHPLVGTDISLHEVGTHIGVLAVTLVVHLLLAGSKDRQTDSKEHNALEDSCKLIHALRHYS